MSLIPEDGTGLETANSLVSLAYANAYWTAHPSTAGAWATATDPTKEEALLVATVQVCRYSFLGCPLSSSQALALPRSWPYIDGRAVAAMPAPILDAVCEYARKHLDKPLNASLKRGGEIASQGVGPMAQSFFPGAPGGNTYPYERSLLRPYLAAGSGQAEAVLSS